VTKHGAAMGTPAGILYELCGNHGLEASQIAKVKWRGLQRPAERKGYLQRSNLNAPLHITETLGEYATAVDVVCPPGERKQ
jgi:hypothetical protein